MAALDLYNAASDLLDAAATALSTTTGGAPSARFVSAGPPSFDCCDMLTVHVVAVAPMPMDEAGKNQMPQLRPAVPMVGFVVTMLRCYPIVEGGVVIRVPQAAAMDTASRTIMEDGWTTVFYLRTMGRRNMLWPSRPCRSVEIGPLTPTPTQGGCAGWTLAAVAELDGYEPF